MAARSSIPNPDRGRETCATGSCSPSWPRPGCVSERRWLADRRVRPGPRRHRVCGDRARSNNPNGARVKMMRPRRVYVSADLERLFADYLTDIACRAAESGIELTDQYPLLVNVTRPPLLAALRETTMREKRATLRRRGLGPPGWTPHWFRHTQPPPCCSQGQRNEWSLVVSATLTCRPPSTSTAGSATTKRCERRPTGLPMPAAGGWPNDLRAPAPCTCAEPNTSIPGTKSMPRGGLPLLHRSAPGPTPPTDVQLCGHCAAGDSSDYNDDAGRVFRRRHRHDNRTRIVPGRAIHRPAAPWLGGLSALRSLRCVPDRLTPWRMWRCSGWQRNP
jgi:hypothetical protein